MIKKNLSCKQLKPLVNNVDHLYYYQPRDKVIKGFYDISQLSKYYTLLTAAGIIVPPRRLENVNE